MANEYYIYADSNTGYFARISDRILADPNLIQVDSMPPNVDYKWDGTNWINLTVTEIEEKNQTAEPLPEIETADIETNTTTIPNSVVFWGSNTGDRLINSGIKLQSATLQFPYNLNLIDKNYLINGKRINPEKERQKIIRIDRKNYSSNSWQLMPDMRLISANLEPALYRIEIELLVKVSRNNRDFEFALFVNNQQSYDNSLNIDFNRGNSDKTLNWSDEIFLEPNSIIEVYWRRSGSSVTCYCDRRKLLIFEI